MSSIERSIVREQLKRLREFERLYAAALAHFIRYTSGSALELGFLKALRNAGDIWTL